MTSYVKLLTDLPNTYNDEHINEMETERKDAEPKVI